MKIITIGLILTIFLMSFAEARKIGYRSSKFKPLLAKTLKPKRVKVTYHGK